MNTSSVAIIIILILILIPAIHSSIVHLKGEGSCCGGPKEKPVRKKIDGTVQSRLEITIGGMHCDNCKNRIERCLDELDGVVAKVNLKKKKAAVDLYVPVDTELIKKTIEEQDFTVEDIKQL